MKPIKPRPSNIIADVSASGTGDTARCAVPPYDTAALGKPEGVALPTPIQAKGAYKGEFPDFHVYRSDDELISMTASAVDSLLRSGFDLADIVVLTGRGRVKSKLLNVDHIGKFSTRHFTGNYTPDGDQIWTAGDLVTETVYRFKGQSSPAVVLSEIDFTDMTDIERNKLFVGLTRAQMAVEIVLSPTADECFRKLLE